MPQGWVVDCTLYSPKAGSHTASSAASTTGMASGRQPAITALTATFSTVASAQRGGTWPITSAAGRPAPAIMARTLSSVGGTMGSPSVQPRSWKASHTSSAEAKVSRSLHSSSVARGRVGRSISAAPA